MTNEPKSMLNTGPVVMPNGNVRLSVQLLPGAYAALTAAAKRDKLSYADVINAAVLTYNAVSTAADAEGHNLGAES
jgi:hypothetical protein